ncbi:hypothetical protein ACFL2V_03570 [Pseudomonadota bacterium]
MAKLDTVLNSTATTAATETGNEFNITDTGIVTTGTDTTLGLDLNVTRTGATGGTINTTGLDLDVTGDSGGTSTAVGLDVNVSGADTNYAALFNGGNVGIGITTPTSALHLPQENDATTPTLSFGDGDSGFYEFQDDGVRLSLGGSTKWAFTTGVMGSASTNYPQMLSEPASATNPVFVVAADSNTGLGHASADNSSLITAGAEAIRIDGSQNIGIGTASPGNKLDVEAASAAVASFNRTTDDGTVIEIQQDGVAEGTITVATNTVSYNAFTGSHYADVNVIEEGIEKGMLISLTGNNRYLNNNVESEIIYGGKLTTRRNDSSVLGAYLALQESTLPAGENNPHLVMAVGNGVMWVVDRGEDINVGDYLISSAAQGHAEKESITDEASHIIARAAENVNWIDVHTTISGQKHQLISVFYENFKKQNASHMRVVNIPSSASDRCTQGETASDHNYIYVCVERNSWKRSTLNTW